MKEDCHPMLLKTARKRGGGGITGGGILSPILNYIDLFGMEISQKNEPVSKIFHPCKIINFLRFHGLLWFSREKNKLTECRNWE